MPFQAHRAPPAPRLSWGDSLTRSVNGGCESECVRESVIGRIRQRELRVEDENPWSALLLCSMWGVSCGVREGMPGTVVCSSIIAFSGAFVSAMGRKDPGGADLARAVRTEGTLWKTHLFLFLQCADCDS